SLGIGGVGEEQVYTGIAEPRESVEVGESPVQWELVHLEVAGVQYDTGHGADGQGQPVGNRVVHGQELDLERTQLLGLALGDGQLVRVDAVFSQLGLDQGEGELGPDDGDVRAFAQQERHRADVVLVPVGEHEG